MGEPAPADGHMLVPCLHRGGAAEQEDFAGRAPVIEIARPVVLHFVIVECRHERRGGVGGLQIGIGLVERVTLPIIVETVELVAVVVAHEGRFGGGRRAGGLSLVDIVAVVIEIGRASWWGRVCTYVEISVVGVTLKKKKK